MGAEDVLHAKGLPGPVPALGAGWGLGWAALHAVAVSGNLAHGWGKRAAVDAGPAIRGVGVRLLVADVPTLPLPQHMDREPPLAGATTGARSTPPGGRDRAPQGGGGALRVRSGPQVLTKVPAPVSLRGGLERGPLGVETEGPVPGGDRKSVV